MSANAGLIADTVDIDLQQWDDWKLVFVFDDPNITLSDACIFQAFEGAGPNDPLVLEASTDPTPFGTVGNGKALVDVATKTITIDISSLQTRTIPADGYYYNVMAVTGDGQKFTFASGNLSVAFRNYQVG